jgi:hypothetical protein
VPKESRPLPAVERGQLTLFPVCSNGWAALSSEVGAFKMSHWKPGWRGENSSHFARSRRRCDGWSGGENPTAASGSPRCFRRRVANFAALCVLALVGWGSEISRAQQQPDFGVYARAVEYCRGVAKRPMALDLDKRVLCFDGNLLEEQDISLAKSLGEKGLFVVRSFGGESRTAMALADLLRERHATVVAYDYCVSACASYLLVASAEAFVMKHCLVAWHHTTAPLCPSLEVPKDGGPKRLEKLPCSDSPREYQRWGGEFRRMKELFFAARAVDPPLEWPPESFTIRKILKSMFEGTGTNPNVLWTWHPRYYVGLIKAKIVYEAYPESQAEVDAMASRLRLPRVLYDP